MVAAQAITFEASYSSIIILQADCVRAYLEALITGVLSFVKLLLVLFKDPLVCLKQ